MKSIIICLALSQVLLTLCNASRPGLTGLYVILGPNTRCSQGYSKLNKDLNKGAEGAYIYICYSFDPAVSSEPNIAGLDVILGDSSSIRCVAGWHKVPVDLNKGSGGKFIYICYARSSSQDPITNLDVVFDDKDLSGTGWRLIDKDLNKGAGGEYIYLIYTNKKDYYANL